MLVCVGVVVLIAGFVVVPGSVGVVICNWTVYCVGFWNVAVHSHHVHLLH